MVGAWSGSPDGQRKRNRPILHDPLAVAVAFRPELVEAEPRGVVVETRGEFTRGFTVASQSDQPNAHVCLGVDSGAFLRLFMERILAR